MSLSRGGSWPGLRSIKKFEVRAMRRGRRGQMVARIPSCIEWCCWNLARGNWLTCHGDEDEREPLSESQFFFFHAFFKTVIAACCGRTGRFLSLAMKSEWKGKIQFFTILGLFTLPLLAKYFLLFRIQAWRQQCQSANYNAGLVQVSPLFSSL